jgi:murein DD-endopeptidase MepM/ murein hydrolase activator NlpD
MTGDHWTFLVIRGEGRAVKQITLSRKHLRALATAGAVALVLLLGGAATLALGGVSGTRVHRLQARNTALIAQLRQFQQRVGTLATRVDGIASKDAEYRSLAGLETIDPEVMEAGVGGPGLGSLNSYPLWTVDSAASKTAFAVSYDLSTLERRARLLSESLTEATDSLVAHRELLEATPSILPTLGWLSSPFSKARMHPIYNRPMPHEGADFAAPKGTPIYAAARGRVIRAGWEVGYGLTVVIDHGHGFTTLYGHASKLLVQRGQMVSRGDVIAQVGSTGITTAPNLHYEVRVNGRPVNPVNYILPVSVP